MANIGEPFIRFARDSAGNFHANNDYSAAPHEFVIQPPRNEDWIINEFFTHMRVGVETIEQLAWDEFGDIPALTNGITVIEHYNGQTNDFTDGVKLKQNYDFLHFGELQANRFAGSIISLKLFTDFRTNSEHRIKLHGQHKDRVVVTINDDLSLLQDIHWMMWGWRPVQG